MKEGEDKLFTTALRADRAILMGIWNRTHSLEQAEEFMKELAFLAQTAGVEAVKTTLQKLDTPHPATFVGKGKLEEVLADVERLEATLVIFDDDLTPTQIRNVERTLNVRVLDRSGLILQIFSEHARTAQARTQVELARAQYMLPRLTRLWTHLSRERGGIGLKGAGEKEIETDRRMLRDRIAQLKEELKHIAKQTETRRKHRKQMVRVTLVGYTNVGKSTLLNALAKSDVLAENKLFATLDTTVRKVVLSTVPFLLADTVGFIRKLPHHLVESFKSTLDEVQEADILVHVVDVSNYHYMEHIRVVQDTLASLQAMDKPMLYVFNKADLLDADELADLSRTWLQGQRHPAVFISAAKREGLEELRNLLVAMVIDQYKDKYPGLDYYSL